jgi:hypothetical protein
MGCPRVECRSPDVRRAESGLIFDGYVCKSCDQSYRIMSPAAKRGGLILMCSSLTGGLDGGLIGAAVASFIGTGNGR